VVTWEVNGLIGGDATHGKISSTGVYTAPSAIPNPAAVTVAAIAQANSNAMAVVPLTVTASSSPVSVSPSATTLAAGATLTFEANLRGSPSAAVNWQVNGVAGGDAAHGTITSSGVYSAPLTPPRTGTATVTAVDQGGSGSGDCAATVAFSNVSLHGPYAFSLSGSDSSGFLAAAGSFTADGDGNISGGLEDANTRAGVSTNLAFSGSYVIGGDGRGSIDLTFADNSFVHWQVALVNDQHAVFSRYYGSVTDKFIVTGAFDRQDVSAFNTGALKGSYIVSLSGINSAAGLLKQAGVFTADGSGTITTGVLDANDGGVPALNLPLSNATYSVSSTGRGTVSLTAAGLTQTFALYALDSSRSKLVETDTTAAVVGEIKQQAAGPFSNLSLTGGYAFTMDGTSANGAYALGGVFTADGAGSLGSGVFDENDGGIVTTALAATSASYAVAANGRGTATLALNDNTNRTLNLVLYPEADGSVAMLDIDSSAVVALGAALAQTGTFTQSNLDGAFALHWDGTLFVTTPVSQEDISGVLEGSGGTLSGVLDISTFNPVTSFLAANSVTGTFLAAANGRATVSLQESLGGTVFNQSVYLVDDNTALTLDSDTRRSLVGLLKRQF